MGRLRSVVISLGRLRTWREVLLTVGAVLGVVCIAVAVAIACFGVRPLVFRSGSMSPAITTGSLAFARAVPADALRIGDVVSVKDSRGVRITHRIVGMDVEGSQATLTLRGDANDVADAAPYVVWSADRVEFSIPAAGYAVAWISGPLGTFAGGAFVALVLVAAFRRPPGRRGRGPERGDPPAAGGSAPRRHPGGRRRGAASVLVLALGLAGWGGARMDPVEPTMATWRSAGAAESTFAAYSIPKPAIGCTRTGNILTGYTITMSWATSGPTQPVVYTARIVQNNRTLTIATSGTTDSVAITSGLLSSIVGGTATVEVAAALTSSPAWSTTADHDFTTGLLGLTFDCAGASY